MGSFNARLVKPWNNALDRVNQIAKLKIGIEGMGIDISSLELQKKIPTRQYGENHPSVVKLKMQLENYRSRKETLEQELIKLERELAADPSDKKEDENKAAQNANTGINESSIRVYIVTLRREKEQHEQAIQYLNEEIKNMEANASIIRAEMAELNLLKNEIREKEKSVSETMDRLSELSVVASKMNLADAYECTPQTIHCESGKTLRVTFELRKKK